MNIIFPLTIFCVLFVCSTQDRGKELWEKVKLRGDFFVKDDLNKFISEASEKRPLTPYFKKFVRFVKNTVKVLASDTPLILNTINILTRDDPVDDYIFKAHLCSYSLGYGVKWIEARQESIKRKRDRIIMNSMRSFVESGKDKLDNLIGFFEKIHKEARNLPVPLRPEMYQR